MDNQRHDDPVAVISIIESVWKWVEQYAPKILIDRPANLTLLLD
jgi:hypothetical protein